VTLALADASPPTVVRVRSEAFMIMVERVSCVSYESLLERRERRWL
jgi:hypothetical protein